jgi:hypothetical protein
MSRQVIAHSAIVGWDRVIIIHRELRNDIDGLTVIAKTRSESLGGLSPDSGLPSLSSSK